MTFSDINFSDIEVAPYSDRRACPVLAVAVASVIPASPQAALAVAPLGRKGAAQFAGEMVVGDGSVCGESDALPPKENGIST
jgi:hypothetical protein